MGSRFYLRSLLLILIGSQILASNQLQIPVDIGVWDEQLQSDVDHLLGILALINNFQGCYSFITYTGTFHLRPSLEQRLMEHFPVPVYTVASNKGPLNSRYPKAGNIVIILFSGLADPTLVALNDTELSSQFFSFLYVPPLNGSRIWTKDDILEFFTWCWERDIVLVFLFLRGESEVEKWTYYHFTNITILRLSARESLKNDLRSHGYRFLVQVTNNPPAIFWYNSTEQADVISGSNVSLSGDLGITIVEFMRYINASMDILPIRKTQSSNYEILEVASSRGVDMVANLVENNSLPFSPILTYTQTCLLVPHRRSIPLDRYFDKALTPCLTSYGLAMAILVFIVKYIAHRRRSLVDTFFNTLRFAVGAPLPGGQLDRLPLADKIIEVYCLLFLGALLGACGSLLSSALTAGIYYPPITDAESMRASGLRIMTSDPTIPQVFRDNLLPISLLDLVDLVDEHTVFSKNVELNDSFVYVVQTANWQGYELYQERLKYKRISLAGPKLCSNSRALRVPISPRSPLRFVFEEYIQRISESGLQRKWLHMASQKFRETAGISKLPRDVEKEFKPLTLSFYTVVFKIYGGGLLLSTLVFIMEVLYKRYHG